MVFCNKNAYNTYQEFIKVTILILIDGFLQFTFADITLSDIKCHNPYFNRWFSAIRIIYNKIEKKEESQSLF